MNSELALDYTGGCRQEACSLKSSTTAWNHSVPTLDPNISMNSFSWNISTSSVSGEKVLTTETRTSLIVLYTFTILFAVVGNILVVIVFSKGGRSRTDIRPFLISLAVADLIMAIFCMPFTFTYVMTRTWIFSKPMCPIVLFMQHLSVSASVFTNMAIGIDRFLVVTFPLRARMTAKRARYTIGIIWVCAVTLSSVQLVVSRAKSIRNFVHCDEQWDSPAERRTFTMFVLFITYVIPLVILAVTYSIVSILLWKRTTPGNAHEGRDLQQLKGKRKVSPDTDLPLHRYHITLVSCITLHADPVYCTLMSETAGFFFKETNLVFSLSTVFFLSMICGIGYNVCPQLFTPCTANHFGNRYSSMSLC